MIYKKKFALISVYNKKNLSSICKVLNDFNIGIISTGTTAKEIIKKGFKCKLVSNLTRFPEILDGRVKTLHPYIHSSLLYKRNKISHLNTFKKLQFPIINFVIVNLYPFEKIIKISKNYNECIEMIDIGGPAMLRSAAKNFESVTTISNISDYSKFIQNLQKNNGETSLVFRRKMAQKVFLKTAQYDNIITNWFLNKKINNRNKKIKLKYGENPNQKSTYLLDSSKNSLLKAKIHGKDLGYNNILDLDSGLNCINEFKEPTCVIIKHNNPCGVASGKTIYNAFTKALDADPISSFGGIVILNRAVNKEMANLITKNFFEVIASPTFNLNAQNILKERKRLILINTSNIKINNKKEIKIVIGGQLSQDKNIAKINQKDFICVSKNKASKKILNDLLFAFKVCKHVKSNAIVLARNKQTIGIGAGQMSRLDATKIAVLKINKKNKLNKFVAASDAFFPFTDNIKILHKNHCIGLVQPSGSINDNKIINFVNNNKMFLYFSKYRVFKH